MEIKKWLSVFFVLLILGGCSNAKEPIPNDPSVVDPQPVTDPFKERSFHVNGIWYDLPTKLENLINDGWEPDVITTLDEELSKTLAGNTYARKYYLRNRRYMMAVTLYNPTASDLSLKDAYIAEVEGENREWLYDDILDFEIDHRVTFATTQEQLVELWGEPDESEKQGLYLYWKYTHSNTASTEIYWDVETGVMFRLISASFRISE